MILIQHTVFLTTNTGRTILSAAILRLIGLVKTDMSCCMILISMSCLLGFSAGCFVRIFCRKQRCRKQQPGSRHPELALLAPCEVSRQALPAQLHPLPPDLAKIQMLPTELIHLITQYLEPSENICLSYTCRTMYWCIATKIEDLFDRYPSTSESDTRLRCQKAYRFLLEIDRAVDPVSPMRWRYDDSFACRGCLTHHDKKDFSMPALRGPAFSRRCLTHEGVLWICPSTKWTMRELSPNVRAGAYECETSSSINGPCSCGRHFTRLVRGTSSSTIIQAFPIAIRQDDSVHGWWNPHHCKFFRTPLRICPHESLSDARPALVAYNSDKCVRTFDMCAAECGCQICRVSQYEYCRECPTSKQIRLHRNRSTGATIVYFLIFRSVPKDLSTDQKDIHRNIGRQPHDQRTVWESSIWESSESPEPRSWSKILYAPSEITRLEEDWNTYPLDNETNPALKAQHLMTGDQDPFRSGFRF